MDYISINNSQIIKEESASSDAPQYDSPEAVYSDLYPGYRYIEAGRIKDTLRMIEASHQAANCPKGYAGSLTCAMRHIFRTDTRQTWDLEQVLQAPLTHLQAMYQAKEYFIGTYYSQDTQLVAKERMNGLWIKRTDSLLDLVKERITESKDTMSLVTLTQYLDILNALLKVRPDMQSNIFGPLLSALDHKEFREQHSQLILERLIRPLTQCKENLTRVTWEKPHQTQITRLEALLNKHASPADPQKEWIPV